jgi:hypothetical protein
MKTVFETSFDEKLDENGEKILDGNGEPVQAEKEEDVFGDWKGIKELTVPKGWTPDWLTPNRGERDKHGDMLKVRPEYARKSKKAGDKEVLTGNFAANFFHVFHSFDACLYRKIKVKKGDWVRASVMARAFSRNQATPGKPGQFDMMIGIDPAGGTLLNGLNVHYGQPYWAEGPDYTDEHWEKLTVEAEAEADEITIFLRGVAKFALEISSAHWDDVKVEVYEDAEREAEKAKWIEDEKNNRLKEWEFFPRPKKEHIYLNDWEGRLSLEQLEYYIQQQIKLALKE